MTSNQIILKPHAIRNVLIKFAVFFITASLAGQLLRIYSGHDRVYGLLPMFNLDKEYNFPSYFSMFILLSASVLLTLIAILEKKRFSTFVSHWVILALGFLYISIDEIISLHEYLISPIRELLGAHAGIFYYAWIIPAIAIIIILALYFYRFLMHLSSKARFTFCISGLVYIAGAIGMEMLGGSHDEIYGTADITYLCFVTIEESLEIFGVIIFIGGLLDYIADNFTEVVFNFEKS